MMTRLFFFPHHVKAFLSGFEHGGFGGIRKVGWYLLSALWDAQSLGSSIDLINQKGPASQYVVFSGPSISSSWNWFYHYLCRALYCTCGALPLFQATKRCMVLSSCCFAEVGLCLCLPYASAWLNAKMRCSVYRLGSLMGSVQSSLLDFTTSRPRPFLNKRCASFRALIVWYPILSVTAHNFWKLLAVPTTLTPCRRSQDNESRKLKVSHEEMTSHHYRGCIMS